MGVKVKVIFESSDENENVHVAARFDSLDSEKFTEWLEKIKPLEKDCKGDYCKIKGFTKNL